MGPVMKDNPCYNCKDRKAPSPENPRTCHSGCERYREYIEKIRQVKQERIDQIRENDDYFAVACRAKRPLR